MSQNEVRNEVKIAGTIKTLKIENNGGFFLLDVGSDKTKFIPVTVYDSPELLQRLERYSVDDQIKVVGFIRAWSQKKDDKWVNKVEVRATNFAGTDPKPKPKPVASRDAGDDFPGGW